MAVIGSLVANLGMNTARFDAGIQKAQGSMNRFSRKASRSFNRMNKSMGMLGGRMAAIGAIGFGALVKNSLDTADAMQKLSIKTGASVGALSQLKFAGEQSGVEFKTLTKSMEKMTNAVAEAKAGVSTYAIAFDALGVNVEGLAKLKPEQQVEVLADAFQQVTDQTDKTALAMDIFGARGTQMLQMFKDGSGGIRELRTEAHNLGITLSQEAANGAADANDAINRAKSAMSAMALESTVNLAPAIEDLANDLSDLIPRAVNSASESFFVFRENSLRVMSFLVQKWSDFAAFVGRAMGADTVGKEIKETIARIAELKEEMTNLSPLDKKLVGNVFADSLKNAERKLENLIAGDTFGQQMAESAAQAELFASALMVSADEAQAVTQKLTGVKTTFSEINAEVPELVGRYKGLSAATEDYKEKTKELGKVIKVDIFDQSKNLFEQMRDQWKSNLAGMVNDWISAGIGKLFKGAFGGKFGKSGGFFSSLFGFARGGSFEVGGGGGTDSNLVAFRATKGETVNVNRRGENGGGGGGIVFQNSYDFRGSTLSEPEVRQMIEQSNRITQREIQNKMIRGRF
tara:strand:+ start:1574 stop:3295 length:1722 start_codon:yes stop_codon:yes gene_type:complete